MIGTCSAWAIRVSGGFVASKDFESSELTELLQDMRDTMAHLNGAGLAAPQIGVAAARRDLRRHAQPALPGRRGSPGHGADQPRYEPLAREWRRAGKAACPCPACAAGCRATPATLSGYDETAARFEREVQGFHARVVQHECDHLDGVLYPMRIRDLRDLGYTDVLFPDAEMVDD